MVRQGRYIDGGGANRPSAGLNGVAVEQDIVAHGGIETAVHILRCDDGPGSERGCGLELHEPAGGGALDAPVLRWATIGAVFLADDVVDRETLRGGAGAGRSGVVARSG